MHAPDWLDALSSHAARLADMPLNALIRAEPGRARRESIRVGPLYANFARQRIDPAARAALLAIAEMRAVGPALRALVDGVSVNGSEQRPALHTALRSGIGRGAVAEAARQQVRELHPQMARWLSELDASPVTDVINVGIGGSDLGPQLALEALREHDRGRFRVHFLSNVDGSAARHLLRQLNPARTATILVSKSFTTQETLLNGGILRDWLGTDARLYAVSANVARATAFGIAPERILPMWDWVGGRYSLWSAVGISIALALGMEAFESMLAGAAMIDSHAVESAPEDNLVLRHGLTAVDYPIMRAHARANALPTSLIGRLRSSERATRANVAARRTGPRLNASTHPSVNRSGSQPDNRSRTYSRCRSAPSRGRSSSSANRRSVRRTR
jgi:glucose-6-phosphate isomerase